MPEVIQDWLGTRLGVLLDLAPQKFGRNTQDGRLLAKLLYSYGVIPAHVLDKIKESRNYHDCYKNLTVLKPWLEYIGVTHDNSTLGEMAYGNGTAAVSVFYAVYLHLENKDRLYYFSKHKEKKYLAEPGLRNFKINWVPETVVKGETKETLPKLAMPLYEKRDMIEWHRSKCKEVIETIRKTREKFAKIVKAEPELGPITSRHTTTQQIDKRLLEAEETKEKIAAFEKAHPQDTHDPKYSELVQMKNTLKPGPCVPNVAEAITIVNNIKTRKKNEIYAKNFQQKMQNQVMEEEWQKILDRQEKEFETTVCSTLLKQSQYEKQMASKLSQIRHRKKVLVENRKLIESLKLEQRDKEYQGVLTENLDMWRDYWWEEEFERERIAELHRRMYDNKLRIRQERIEAESWKICEALIDIAIKVSEIRELTGCVVPKSIMKDMKELFFKDLPVFDILEHLEELYGVSSKLNLSQGAEDEEEEEEDAPKNEQYVWMKEQEAVRQYVLDECDLNDYLNLLGPWMVQLLFPDDSETEVKHVVLGYIVHKLLAIKYPPQNVPHPLPVRPMKPAAVLQGLTDETAIKMLTDLMEARKVLVVRVEDAINFVLSAYKDELSVVRDIDIVFQKITAKSLMENTIDGKEKDVKKKLQLLKTVDSEKLPSVQEECIFMSKETQTPRVLPEEEPNLTPNAVIGKLAFEFLGAGDPVPEPVIVSSIVAYVAAKQDFYEGWVLLNYPNLYIEASELECALTGYRILPKIDDMDSMEDVEGFSFREPCVDPFATDETVANRMSRLVPRPPSFMPPQPRPEAPKTYFDSFIKLTKMAETPRKWCQDVDEVSPLDKFYCNQEILHNFEYLTINFQMVKNLGKAILGELIEPTAKDPCLLPKTSVEIFGNVLLELNEKWDPKKKTAKETSGGVKKMKMRESRIEEPPREVSPQLTPSTTPTLEEKGGKNVATPAVDVKPGDPEWEWATGPQPEVIQIALASLWENMEAVYTEDFKDIFFALRSHRANVLSYCGFIRNSVRNLMRRHDEKQKVLADFQQMFNDIDEDLRPDVDIKGELHVRVSELQECLMSIADERKLKSQKDIKKVAQDGWVSDEMASLVNFYLTAVQLEADRCVDSCQLIMDYYLSLQEKLPEEKPIAKFVVGKLLPKDKKIAVVPSPSFSLSTPGLSDVRRSTRSILEHWTKSLTKTRSRTDKRRQSSESSILSGASDVINDILVNLKLPDDELTPFHHFFMDNVQAATAEIKNTVEVCLAEAKKGDKVASKQPTKGDKTKKAAEVVDVKSEPAGNVIAEWSTAIENELSRFLFRMKLILARGIFEMNEFLMTILNMLSSLSDEVSEMYLKEIDSISECCKIFRCAIEEEIPIKWQLELREDEFWVNEDVLLTVPSEENFVDLDDDHNRFRFSVEQLSLLFQKLQRVAPDGEIIKRSLVYILEDLRAMKTEDEQCNCFPDVWGQIEPEDLAAIIDEVYQDLEIVHWKDFIIYALELPVPTEQEILAMRRLFRRYDPLVTELISRDKYDTFYLWFETTLDHYQQADRYEKAKDLLFKMYQVDECQTNYSALLLAFCKDENPMVGFVKALTLVMGRQILVHKPTTGDETSLKGEFDGEESYPGYEESVETVKKPFCCPSNPSDFIGKCVPRRKQYKCPCPDVEKSQAVTEEEEEEEEEDAFAEEHGEIGSIFYSDSKPTPGSMTSVVPINILSPLLKVSYPSLSQLSILLDCKQTFQDTLNATYDSLETYDGNVDAYELLHHKFIYRLIQSTNKFKFVKIRPLVMALMKGRKSWSDPDKSSLSLFLN